MSKATLEFDLSEPHEQQELNLKLRATDMAIALWDVEQMFRHELKYNEDITDDQYTIVEKLQEKYFDMIDDRNLKGMIE